MPRLPRPIATIEPLEPRALLSGNGGMLTSLELHAGLHHTVSHRRKTPRPRPSLIAGGQLLHTTHAITPGRYNAATVGHFVLLSGDDNIVDVYDASSGTWRKTSAPDSVKLTGGPYIAPDPMVLGGDAVYVATPTDGSDHLRLEIYDPTANQWSSLAAPEEVEYGQRTVVGSKVIFAGGVKYIEATQSEVNLDSVAIFDTATGQWSTSRLSVGRLPDMAVVGHRVIFAGGIIEKQVTSTFSSAAVDIYDADTGQWSTAALSSPRHAMHVAVVDGKAVFAGGYQNFGGDSSLTHDADVYDSATGQWSTTVLRDTGYSVGVATIGAQAIFMSGRSVDIYDATTGQWTYANLGQGGSDSGIAILGTKAIFAGGANGGDPVAGFNTAVDIYDSVSGQWSKASLWLPRQPGAAVLGNFAFFIASLLPGPQNVEVYNGATNQWFAPTPFDNWGSPAAVGTQLVFASDATGHVYTDLAPTPVLCGYLTGQPGGVVSVTLQDSGDAALAPGATVAVYASKDRTLARALLLGSTTLPTSLPAGESVQVNVATTIPAGADLSNFHLLAAAGPSQHLTPIAAHATTISGE
jgi:hypothetical protein